MYVCIVGYDLRQSDMYVCIVGSDLRPDDMYVHLVGCDLKAKYGQSCMTSEVWC